MHGPNESHEGHDRQDQPADDLSLQEAAELYDVPYKTLGNRVRNGEIGAYKVQGPWAKQWRVTREALEAFGYRLRQVPAPRVGEQADSPPVEGLERELAAARRAVASERNRAAEADRRLGEALLECGRLRAALQRAEEQWAARGPVAGRSTPVRPRATIDLRGQDVQADR